MFQIGAEHYLYLAYDNVTTPRTINTLIKTDFSNNDADVVGPPAVTYTSVNGIRSSLKVADLIRDVTVGGSNNTVDTTTRQLARQGLSGTLISTSDRNMTVQFVYEPRNDDGTPARQDLAILQYCFATKSSIFAIDLDKPITTGGAQGTGANFSIGFSNPKPVQDLVVLDVEFALTSFGQEIYIADNGGANEFRALVDP